MEERTPALLVLNAYEARTASAVFERLFPADEHGPGATEIGVLTYLDRALAGAYRDRAEAYRIGLAALDLAARRRCVTPFADCTSEQQDALITDLEQGVLPNFLGNYSPTPAGGGSRGMGRASVNLRVRWSARGWIG